MTFLLLQTFLWMLLAFLLGGMLGCLAKRLLQGEAADEAAVPAGATVAARVPGEPVIAARTAPAPVTPPAPAGGIERAGAGYDYAAGSTRGAPERVQPHIQKIDLTATEGAARTYPITTIGIPPGHVQPPERTFPITTVGIPSGYSQPQAAPPKAAAAPIGREPAQPRPEPLRPELARPASTTAAAPAPTAPPRPLPPVQVVTPAASSESASAVAARVITKAPEPPADDLTRIRAIDETLQARLRDAGVTRLAQVAKWTPDDVSRISQALGLTNRIGAENWVEQAQILASGGETEYSRRRQRGEAPAPVATAPMAAPAAAAAPAASPAPSPVVDDLTRVRAIDDALQRRLRDAGVSGLAQMAKWNTAEVARLSASLGLGDRISAENWIEQAQILSSGGETEYSRRRQRGEIPIPAPAAPAAEAPVGPADTAPGDAQRQTAVSAMAERATAIAAAAAAAASAAAAATPSAPTPARLSDALRQSAGSPESAGEAGRGPRPDLSGLRSVRSEALRGDVTALETARGASGPARGVGSADDLKRIRGIGVLIEKKLNSIGVTSYEQVANWTNADIDRVSQILDFKGRVERESWVEQARILASGGQTDFASRVDRGEV